MSTEHTPYEIFISYCRKDNIPVDSVQPGWVTALVKHISEDHRRFSTAPLRIFFDADEIRDMDDWRHRILAALQRSKILLVCLSPGYFESTYCQWEWKEYLMRQVHTLTGSDTISSIYFIEAPGSDADENAEWRENVMRYQYTDIRPWFPEGPIALQREEVKRRMEVLGQSLWDRLERARRAESAPGNLRRANPYFVGRVEELRRLHEQLSLGAVGVVTALHGLGGQGKTELALTYAHSWADCYPAGLWVLGAEGKSELLPLIGELAFEPAMNYTPTEDEKADPARLGKAVISELQRRTEKVRHKDPDKGAAVLIVLDNVTYPSLLSPVQLAALPRSEWLRIIATTRIGPDRLSEEGKSLALIAIDSLNEEDALTLLREHQPGQRFGSAEDEAAARQIVRELDGLTLSVEQVAVYMGLHPEIEPGTFLERLQQKGFSGVDALPEDAAVSDRIRHQQRQLGLILADTLEKLEPPARTALDFAALLPPDTVPWPWLRALTLDQHKEMANTEEGVPDPWISARRRLEGLRLLTPGDYPETARIHRMVAAYLRDANESNESGSRQVHEYLAKRAWELYYSTVAPAAWEMAALIGSLPVFLETYSGGNDLANAAIFFSEKVQTYHTLEMTQSTIMAAHSLLIRSAAADPGNAGWQRDLSVSYEKIGNVLTAQGDLKRALDAFQQSMDIREKLAAADPGNAGWQRDLWVSYWKIADISEKAGNTESQQLWQKAHDILAGMKKKGMFISPGDEQFLAILKKKIAS